MSEALRLADLVEHDPLAYSDDAAAELRRLSAELAALKAAYAIAAIEAQGVSENRCITELKAYAEANPGTYIFPRWDGQRVAKYLASSPPALQAEQHTDDAAVDRFAAAMKDKLAIARQKGRGGWETCSAEDLGRMLREHVEKGDPRDVANFCMFLWSLGHGIAPQASVVQQEPVAWVDPGDFELMQSQGRGVIAWPKNYPNATMPLYTNPAQQALTPCNCRWDGETQVQQCTLHKAHVEAIHEWAERAKTAEKTLSAQQAKPQPLSDEQERALCEAYCNAASDEYFKARPQLDSDVNRRIFYAGHRKAWIEYDAAHGIKGS